ncbi:hypothetical protein BpHYR1_021756, partial [Brachionus plicatilis]
SLHFLVLFDTLACAESIKRNSSFKNEGDIGGSGQIDYLKIRLPKIVLYQNGSTKKMVNKVVYSSGLECVLVILECEVTPSSDEHFQLSKLTNLFSAYKALT